METLTRTPKAQVWQFATGFANTQVTYTLVKSGIIEQLRDEEKSLEQLVSVGPFNKDVLYRVLRFSSAIGLVTCTDGSYSLTETGRLLLKGVPGSMYGGILLIGTEPWQRSWNNLLHSLNTGEPSFDSTMGAPLFDYLNNHPEYDSPYNDWMTSSTLMSARAIAEAYDFSLYHTLCDIGGGQGVLLKEIMTAYPHLDGILYDQESVVATHVLDEMSGRVEIHSGDFLKQVPAADVLMMKSVLHDWDDAKSLQILAACKQVMTPGTKLLILDMVVADESDHIGLFFDLHMQVLLNSRERTEAEFYTLIEKAGLKIDQIIATRSPLKIIEVSC
ncbi:methyltransferase [Telluribacter humicola]